MCFADSFTLTMDPTETGVVAIFATLTLFSLGFLMFGGGRP